MCYSVGVDRNIRLYKAGKIRSQGYPFRVTQIIKADVLCTLRGNVYPIGADWFAIRVEDRDRHRSLIVSRVQNANGLMTGEVWLRAMLSDVMFA